MAVLQSVPQMRKRLGYDNIDVVNDAIESSLESATIALEDSIRTGLERVTVQDIFFVVQSREFARRNQNARSRMFSPFGLRGVVPDAASTTELKLSRGFVATDQTITAVAATSLRNALGTGDGQNFDLKSPDDFTVLEQERGVLHVHDYLLNNLYVVVTYTAGFSTDLACPELFETTGTNILPGWLGEAAALKTALLLDGNPVVRREPLGDETIRNANSARKVIQGQLDSIMTSRVRYSPLAWKPLQSTITPV